MRLPSLLLMTCVAIVALAGCVNDDADNEPVREPDATNLDGPLLSFSKIHHPDEIAQRIDELGQLPGVSASVIGESVEGRPIHLVSIGDGPFDLWIQGRIHGNEPTGAEAILLAIEGLAAPGAHVPDDAPESFRMLIEHREALLERVTFHFVPVANPDGAALWQRGGILSPDMNRDWFLFNSPEPQQIKEAYWNLRPDGCLDLHNEGLGATDWDAFNPDGPLVEPEIFDLMIDDIWKNLFEVDAAGGRGGGPNEFYNLIEDAPVVGDVVNPTAYHPGTHDMFCSTRGAPGWTPEGALGSLGAATDNGNGATDHFFAWSTRLHQVTIAAAAFNWAGWYENTESTITKESFDLSASTSFELADLPASESLLIQVVWRNQAVLNDFSGPPVTISVTGPAEGSSGQGDLRPFQWAQTVLIADAPAGDYTATVASQFPGDAELRVIARTAAQPLIEVQRMGDHVHISGLADGTMIRVTDSYDGSGHPVDHHTPAPLSVHGLQSSVAENQRAIVTWAVMVNEGDQIMLDSPDDRTGIGPYRFTAVGSDGSVQMGVERVRNAPEGADAEPPSAEST